MVYRLSHQGSPLIRLVATKYYFLIHEMRADQSRNLVQAWQLWQKQGTEIPRIHAADDSWAQVSAPDWCSFVEQRILLLNPDQVSCILPLEECTGWRIPGTGEPGGLPSIGSHRVGHDWSDAAAAAAAEGGKWRDAGWRVHTSCYNQVSSEDLVYSMVIVVGTILLYTWKFLRAYCSHPSKEMVIILCEGSIH